MTVPTDIQAAAIPHALAGRDILGAAKTGSGKTLSFVIPLVEKLFVERWGKEDGLGALVITPTRELALQIFEVIRSVGKKHQFSAGLVTGGKKEFEEEQMRVVDMNILVATPGRLLQHFEQTKGFDASQLMVLVLDEADRILDMGFSHQLDSILEYLPTYRQTMLFSATQTKSVKDLARLSLKEPEYLAVHAEEEAATPKLLVQNYIVCRLPEKLDIIFSFIKTHLKSKVIIFFSTCAQVRFVYECFCAMQPGIPISALHGKIKQERRTIIFMDYARRKSAVLLATDIAARGLDFPDVDWVVQADAPEDEAMYIHRVGRTARYTSGGRALLLLTPNEESMVMKKLGDSSVPVKKLTVNPKKAFSVAAKAAALLAAQPEFRLLAKKAFVGYLRSLQMMVLPKGHEMIDINKLPLDEYASSLGLAFTPPLPIVAQTTPGDARDENRKEKNVNRSLDKLKQQIKEAKAAKKATREQNKLNAKLGKGDRVVELPDESDDEDSGGSSKKKLSKAQKQAARIRTGVATSDGNILVTSSGLAGTKKDSDDEIDDLLVVRRTINGDAAAAMEGEVNLKQKEISSKKLKKMKLNVDGEDKVAQKAGRKKIIFGDDEYEDSRDDSDADNDGAGQVGAAEELQKRILKHTAAIKQSVDANRKADLEREKQRLREKRLAVKDRLKKSSAGDDDIAEGMVQLASGSDDDYNKDSDRESDSDSEASDGGIGFPSEADSNNDLDSDSDSDAAPALKNKNKRKAAAASEEEDNSSVDSAPKNNKSKKKSKRNNVESIREQEQLALKLLAAKR